MTCGFEIYDYFLFYGIGLPADIVQLKCKNRKQNNSQQICYF